MKRFVMVLRFESRDCPFRSVIVGVTVDHLFSFLVGIYPLSDTLYQTVNSSIHTRLPGRWKYVEII